MDEDGVVINPAEGNPPDPTDGDISNAPQVVTGMSALAGSAGAGPAKPSTPEPDSLAEEEESRIFEITSDTIAPAAASSVRAPAPVPPVPTGPKTAPADPRPKKIGYPYGSTAQTPAEAVVVQSAPRNLQEALASIIPNPVKPPTQPAVPAKPATTPATPAANPTASSAPSIPKAPVGSVTQIPTSTSPAAPIVSKNTPAFAQKIAPDPSVKPLRTYESDVAEVLSHRNISQASITIAENRRRGKKGSMPIPAPATAPANIPMGEPMPIPMPAPTRTEKPAPSAASDVTVPTEAASIAAWAGTPESTKPWARPGAPKDEAFVPRQAPRETRPQALAEPQEASPEPRQDFVRNISTGAPMTIPEISAEMEGPPSHNLRKSILALVSLALIGGGIYGGYYFYKKSPVSAPAPVIAAPTRSQSLIRAESQAVVSIDGLNSAAITAGIKAEAEKPQAPNSVKEIILAKAQGGSSVRVGASDALSAASIPIPDLIARTLLPIGMLGVYSDASGSRSVFAIVQTDFFQNAFAGMLQWEASMPYDLQNDVAWQPATTTIRGQFTDHIVRNADVREFTTPDGGTAFLYSFVDNTKLVFAANERALMEIQSRLEQQAFVR